MTAPHLKQSISTAALPMPRAYTILSFTQKFGVGRTTTFAEIAAGRLRAVKAGGRTLIPSDAAEAWLAGLPAVRPSADLPSETREGRPRG